MVFSDNDKFKQVDLDPTGPHFTTYKTWPTLPQFYGSEIRRSTNFLLFRTAFEALKLRKGWSESPKKQSGSANHSYETPSDGF